LRSSPALLEIRDSCPISAAVAVGVSTASVFTTAGRGVRTKGDVEIAGVVALVLQPARNMLT
jgi:hypothetical protein